MLLILLRQTVNPLTTRMITLNNWQQVFKYFNMLDKSWMNAGTLLHKLADPKILVSQQPCITWTTKHVLTPLATWTEKVMWIWYLWVSMIKSFSR